MSSILTKRPISHDEASAAVQRLVNSHFNNHPDTHEHGRMSIPANPDRDDDLVLSAYIEQQRAREAPRMIAPPLMDLGPASLRAGHITYKA